MDFLSKYFSFLTLKFSLSSALAKAEEICKQRGGDAEAARLHTDCLFATWSVGDVAKECGRLWGKLSQAEKDSYK